MSRYQQIDLTSQKRYKACDRLSKVDTSLFARTGNPELSRFWALVPDILKARELKALLAACQEAYKEGKPILIGMGGHVIKCGLAPLLIDLMKTGAVRGIAVNGSVLIHDYEIALYGQTSEEVDTALEDGSFGMASDTADGINALVTEAYKTGSGLGEAVGKALAESAPHKELSLLAMAYAYQVPLTVHVAIGTDIIHQHASANGAALGETSLRDFRIFCNLLTTLNEGGVFLNFGSSVIIPEVFLKAVSVVRNLGFPLRDLTTAVFDMNIHYRPFQNVVRRPVLPGGKGYYFVGHHEIMLPLFILSLKELL